MKVFAMRTLSLLLAPPLLALAACGGSDPTPEMDESANASSIGNSVDEAQQDQEAAENRFNEMEAANERGEALAEKTIARADEANRNASNSNEVIPPVD
jgi:Flp pilus assembly protein TadD